MIDGPTNQLSPVIELLAARGNIKPLRAGQAESAKQVHLGDIVPGELLVRKGAPTCVVHART